MPLKRLLFPCLVVILFALGCVQTNRNAPAEPQGWVYEEKPDQMGRGTVKTARVTSTNTLSFKFPYGGEQRARLALRKHPTQGNDVMLAVERGQFLAGVEPCALLVRFDEGPPINFLGNAPSDHSTNVVFLNDYDRFVNRLRHTNRLRIEATFFQEGAQVMDFDVSGLKW